MGKDMALPKNIRQIGDIQGEEKIYMEDYVMTYIRKMEEQEERGSVGILLGERCETQDGVFVFVRGILDVPQERQEEKQERKAIHTEEKAAGKNAEKNEKQQYGVQETNGENEGQKQTETDTVEMTEAAQNEEEPLTLKEKIHRARIEYFPGWDVQGCCVIGKYRPEQFEELSEILPDVQQLIYHLQEQEETLYWKSQGQYCRIRGYFVFYEQNRKMQEYLSDVFRDATVEQESMPERAIKNFRQKVREKGEQKTGSILKLASSFFVATVLVAGALVVDRVEEMRSVRNVVNINSDTAKEQWDLEYTKERMLAQQQDNAAVQTAAEGQRLPADAVIEGEQPEVDAAPDIYAGDTEQAAAMQSQSEAMQVSVQEQSAGERSQGIDVQEQSTGERSQGIDVQEQSADAQNQGTGEQRQDIGVQGQSAGQQNPGADVGAQTETEDQNASMQLEDAAQSTDLQHQGGNVQRQTDAEQTAAVQGALQTAADALDDTWMEGSDSFWEDEAQEASVRSTQASYVIKSGDTLAGICQQYYGSLDKVSQLCEANRISDANSIMPGQKIVLP